MISEKSACDTFPSLTISYLCQVWQADMATTSNDIVCMAARFLVFNHNTLKFEI